VRDKSMQAGLLIGFMIALGATAVAAPQGTKPSSAASSTRGAEKLTPQRLAEAKSLGSKNATVVIEDFADFQCPVCKILYEATTEQVIKNYVDTGKVYFVHHDYPLTKHAHSREAARWANAAAAIGKFEQAETALYAQQEIWGASGDIQKTLSSVLTAAEMKRCGALVNDPAIDLAIQNDIDLGMRRGVNSTPCVFVTHNATISPLPPGAVEYSLLKQYIDYLLKP
jgi:protein-disulfide isomerase